MSVVLSIDGSLVTTTTKHPGGSYSAIDIGKPLGIQLLTFFPGTNIQEWKGKAELMITSQVRIGPSNKSAPEHVNMILRGYNFRQAEPVRNYGGDVYGDRMLYYTKAYAGQKIGITLRGVELDKINRETWDGITATIGALGRVAQFTPAAPYFAAAGVASRMFKTIVKAINRNDRLTIQRSDFFYDEPHRRILQSGRYLLWGKETKPQTMRSHYRLTGEGDDVANVLVEKEYEIPYRNSPYLVLQIDAKERKSYNNFEIGAGSAELLKKWGDKRTGTTILHTMQELARQVNDARQLDDIKSLFKDFGTTKSEVKKTNIRKKIKAHTELFSKDNGDLLKMLLKKYM